MTPDKKLTRDTMYLKLANQLRDRILSREFKPGKQLPTEQVLGTEYGVSRTVVRDAVEILVNEGMVIRQQGKGTFVAPPDPSPIILEPDEDPWTDLVPVGQADDHRAYAEPDLAGLLGVPLGEHLFVSRILATSRTTRHPVITRRVIPLSALAPIRPAPDPYSPRPTLLTALTDHYGPLTARIYTRPTIPTGDQWPDLGITKAAPGAETVYLTTSTGPTPQALIADVQLTCAPVRHACRTVNVVTGA